MEATREEGWASFPRVVQADGPSLPSLLSALGKPLGDQRGVRRGNYNTLGTDWDCSTLLIVYQQIQSKTLDGL